MQLQLLDSCGFQVQNPKGKSNPLEIENFGTCTNILSDRANFATNVQAQSKIRRKVRTRLLFHLKKFGIEL